MEAFKALPEWLESQEYIRPHVAHHVSERFFAGNTAALASPGPSVKSQHIGAASKTFSQVPEFNRREEVRGQQIVVAEVPGDKKRMVYLHSGYDPATGQMDASIITSRGGNLLQDTDDLYRAHIAVVYFWRPKHEANEPTTPTEVAEQDFRITEILHKDGIDRASVKVIFCPVYGKYWLSQSHRYRYSLLRIHQRFKLKFRDLHGPVSDVTASSTIVANARMHRSVLERTLAQLGVSATDLQQSMQCESRARIRHQPRLQGSQISTSTVPSTNGGRTSRFPGLPATSSTGNLPLGVTKSSSTFKSVINRFHRAALQTAGSVANKTNAKITPTMQTPDKTDPPGSRPALSLNRGTDTVMSIDMTASEQLPKVGGKRSLAVGTNKLPQYSAPMAQATRTLPPGGQHEDGFSRKRRRSVESAEDSSERSAVKKPFRNVLDGNLLAIQAAAAAKIKQLQMKQKAKTSSPSNPGHALQPIDPNTVNEVSLYARGCHRPY